MAMIFLTYTGCLIVNFVEQYLWLYAWNDNFFSSFEQQHCKLEFNVLKSEYVPMYLYKVKSIHYSPNSRSQEIKTVTRKIRAHHLLT